jgi:hypothetical protein
MLLDSEIRADEIYISDKNRIILSDDEKPQLFQMVQEPVVTVNRSMFGSDETIKQNALWENVVTGELVDWGTHCFTTIERMKKQYANIGSITDKRRVEYVKEAFVVIRAYEGMAVEE